MDTRANPPEKRPQKYLHFKLEPGDEELISKLPVNQQAALRAQGPYSESAKEHGIPVGTFRSRLHRGRAAIVKMREQRAAKPVEGVAAEPVAMH